MFVLFVLYRKAKWGVEWRVLVSCAASVNTADCFEPFFWKITHFIIVVTLLFSELFKYCNLEK